MDDEPPEYNADELIEDNIHRLEDKIKGLQGSIVTASGHGDPETLSTTLLRLARVNAVLGKYAAYANYLARNADRAARRFRASKTLDYSNKQAVNKSELQAELDAREDFNTASNAQLVADTATDLCFRTDTFMKMAQSRLSLIKNDIKG